MHVWCQDKNLWCKELLCPFVFSDLYPVLMRLLQFHLSVTSTSDCSSRFGHEHGAAVMCLLKEAMLVADAQMKRSASQKEAKSTQRIVVTVSYEHLSGFTQLLHLCLKKWINQLAIAEEITVRGKLHTRNKRFKHGVCIFGKCSFSSCSFLH
jgi:hypothetical protein